MFVQILLTLGFFIVLLILSINLFGFLVRGLFVNPSLSELTSSEYEVIRNEAKKVQRAESWANLIALLAIFFYCYLLVHFWNIGVMGVAVVLMITRLPDLLWEIKHGKKITKKDIPKNIFSNIAVVIDFLMIPVLYYFLYSF